MTTTVYCQRLKRQAPALPRAPFPGAIGANVLENVSLEAWQQWLAKQTMLINENRLNPLEPKAKKYLLEQMQAFLFGDGGDAVAGYTAPER
jgi:Fe-S cluster biosynthesis and repair protein YggX